MSQRFVSNGVLGLAGAAGVVASQAFSADVIGWVTFGISLGALALLAFVQHTRSDSTAQLIDVRTGLDVAVGALALWSAVASVVYSGTTLTWLSFAETTALVVLAVAGLIAHEVRTEHLLHAAAETRPAPARAGNRPDELEAAA